MRKGKECETKRGEKGALNHASVQQKEFKIRRLKVETVKTENKRF